MHFLRNLTVTALAFALLASPSQAEEESGATLEYPIVAAYIYNFTQFTTWPASAPADRFTLCVVGSNPFGDLLEPLKNKTARGANFTLRYLRAPDATLAGCSALFIAISQAGNMKAIVRALAHAPVLTISNADGFAEVGGMVELYKEDTKIAMRINNHAVQDAGLSISSKLLSLAHVVNSSEK